MPSKEWLEGKAEGLQEAFDIAQCISSDRWKDLNIDKMELLRFYREAQKEVIKQLHEKNS